MGQLSRAERDLLQKLMKAREGPESTNKQGKVASMTRLPCWIMHTCSIKGNLLISAGMHVTSM